MSCHDLILYTIKEKVLNLLGTSKIHRSTFNAFEVKGVGGGGGTRLRDTKKARTKRD